MAIDGILYVSIFSADLDRSRSFYSRLPGWKLETNEENVAGFRFGSGYLVVLSDSRSASERIEAVGTQVAVQVGDVAAEHTRLKEAGIGIGEIIDQPWGERHFSFTDPDGYVWFYSQVASVGESP